MVEINFGKVGRTILMYNTVKAEIVSKPEDYIYSSARNYAGLDNILPISVASLRWKTVN